MSKTRGFAGITFVRHQDGGFMLLFGCRPLIGWLHFILVFNVKVLFYRLWHGVNPQQHKWRFLEAPECGCCGEDVMWCRACRTQVVLNEALNGYIKLERAYNDAT